jgi:hypothetical protein
MKDFKKFIKPGPLNILLPIVMVIWHYLYYVTGSLKETIETAKLGMPLLMESIDWSSYVLRKISFLGVWLIVTAVVFALFLLVELVMISRSNRKSGDGSKVEGVSYAATDIAKERKLSLKENLSKSGVLSMYFLLIMLINSLPAGLEKMRIGFVDNVFMYFLEDGLAVDYDNTLIKIASILLVFIIWYIIVMIITGIIRLLKKEEHELELTKEHLLT